MPLIAHPRSIRHADELLGEAQRLLDVETVALGDAVSCQPNCTMCCHHAVAVTPAETRLIADAIAQLPERRRRRITERSRAIMARVESTTGSDGFAMRYFGLREPCPLLFDGNCIVRDVRPLVCRDYVVSSDPAHCADPAGERLVRIRRRHQVSRGFRAVSRELGESVASLLPAALLAERPAAPSITERRGADLAMLLFDPPHSLSPDSP